MAKVEMALAHGAMVDVRDKATGSFKLIIVDDRYAFFNVRYKPAASAPFLISWIYFLSGRTPLFAAVQNMRQEPLLQVSSNSANVHKIV